MTVPPPSKEGESPSNLVLWVFGKMKKKSNFISNHTQARVVKQDKERENLKLPPNLEPKYPKR